MPSSPDSLLASLFGESVGFGISAFSNLFAASEQRKAYRQAAVLVRDAAAWNASLVLDQYGMASEHLARSQYRASGQYETSAGASGTQFSGSPLNELQAQLTRDLVALDELSRERDVRVAQIYYQGELDARNIKMRGDFAAADYHLRAAGAGIRALGTNKAFRDWATDTLLT